MHPFSNLGLRRRREKHRRGNATNNPTAIREEFYLSHHKVCKKRPAFNGITVTFCPIFEVNKTLRWQIGGKIKCHAARLRFFAWKSLDLGWQKRSERLSLTTEFGLSRLVLILLSFIHSFSWVFLRFCFVDRSISVSLQTASATVSVIHLCVCFFWCRI